MIPTNSKSPRALPVLLLLLLVATFGPTTTAAMALANKQVSVSQLIQTHTNDIARLKELTMARTSLQQAPYNNDVFYLRHCLDHAEDTKAQAQQLQTALDWRLGPGKDICAKAAAAVAAATSDTTKSWNNEPVYQAAPHQPAICPFISSANMITTTTSQGDLVYCIRAGQINDKDLMNAVTVDQMVDFFLYAKEVNCLVANSRSLQTNRLLGVLTANDLAGVKLLGGSAEFRTALSRSSKQAAAVYPDSTTGPTLLLNLPTLLSALVQIFTPLFPPAVRERLMFVQGPLANVKDLQQVALPESTQRLEFLRQLDQVVYAS